MNKGPLIATGIVVFAVAVYFLLSNNQGAMQGPEAESITVNLNQYSDSGQSGTARLTEHGGMLRVELNLSGYEAQSPQPAHIHTGLCPRIGPVIFALNDVVDGKSTTELETTLDDLLSSNEELNVNVHESKDNIAIYTSCGDVL